jgi:serine/threonine protein kinase
MVGKRIHAYRLTRLLGEGGMSQVFEAVHETIAQRAAVKILNPQFARDPHYVQRFFTEACAIALLRHPDLVQIFDHGQLADGTVYILMEYLDGQSLGARMNARGALPLPEVLRLARQIASVLALTHSKGIVHRDLKPENVFILPDREAPGGERVKLLDFGIAKVLPNGSVSNSFPSLAARSLAGMVLGTPVYMAPEQCQGDEVGDRADVYSLGVMIFEMVAGKPPFDGAAYTDIIMKHLTLPPPTLAEAVPGSPPALSALVAEMLAKEPAQRPTMEQVAWRLARLAERSEASPTVSAQTSQMDLNALGARPRLDPSFAVSGLLAGLALALGLLLVLPGSPLRGKRGASPPAEAPQPPPAVSPPVAQQVRWTLKSTPPGAQVLRAADGAPLGVTPWVREGAGRGERLEVLLRLQGFTDQPLSVECQADCEQLVVLKAAPVKRARPGRRGAGPESGAGITPPRGGLGELPD